MRTEIKYLSVGLVIGVGFTTLLATGMLLPYTLAAPLSSNPPTATYISSTPTHQPSPTPHPPTSTFTPTPTYIKLKTETSTTTPSNTPTAPTPTPTHTPTPTLSDTVLGLFDNGYLWQTGPLSLKQQINLYEASLNYIRTNENDSRRLGEEINGKGYGAPSDICGPLSIAILQEAGLAGAGLDPHRFWLLNPDVRDDRRLLAKAFPPGQFENKRYKVKLNKVDWNQTPLHPGDFVYIYAGTGGNFEHMLVVNRVDSDGRAYAVTNHKTDDGFIISEVLLYNPANPDVGMFPVWTMHPNAETGSTGFAGYEIWRLRSP